MTDRLLLAEISVGIRSLEKSMRRAGVVVDGAAEKMARRWDKNNRRMAQSTQKAARLMSTALGGIGVGAALTVGARTIAEFRQSMSTVAAITNATGGELVALEDSARNLGATTRFSASEAAEGMIALGRAGFDTNEVLGSIEGTLLLAQAGALDLGEAADIASNVLQGFRLSADETGRVVDVLSSAANSSNTNVTELGQALSFVAPIAAVAGVRVEEAAAAVGALSDAGIKSTRAGTGLRQIILKLSAAGHDFSEEAGGLSGVLKGLATQNIGLAEATKLVDVRQAGALLTLIDSVDKVGDLTVAYENAAGSARRTAQIMDDNLNGALLATRSRLEEMTIALGEAGGEQALIEALGKLQDLLTFVAENATTFNKAIIVLSASMAGLIGGKALGGAAIALNGYRKAMIAANVATGTSTLSIKGMTVAVRTLLKALGPVGWITIAAGAIAAFTQFGSAADTAAQKIENFDDTLNDLSRINKEIQEDSKELHRLNAELASSTLKVGEAAQSAKVLEVNALNVRIAKNKELAETYKTLLRAQVTSGQAEVNEIERKQLGLTNVRTSRLSSNSSLGLGGTSRTVSPEEEKQLKQEGFNKLLEEANEAAEKGIALTKKQSQALELQIARAEALAKVEDSRKQLNSLSNPAALDLQHDGLSQFLDATEKPAGGTSGRSKPTKVDSSIESQLRALEELGRTEREQIEFIKQKRLDAIEASKRGHEERARLIGIVNADAAKSIEDLEKRETDARDKAFSDERDLAEEKRENKAEELALGLEIKAAAAELHGNTLKATQLEIAAERVRLRAKLNSFDEIERRQAELDIKRLDAAERDINNQARNEVLGLGADDNGLDGELARIDEIEQEKLLRLAEYQGTELEQLRDFEQLKTQIMQEANEARQQALQANLQARLEGVKANIANISGLFKEGSRAAEVALKAQRAIAKAQQGIAIAQVLVNTAKGVSQALGSVPFPFNIAAAAVVAAKGAAQVGAIRKQQFTVGGVNIQGRGSTASDSVPASLSVGESVITSRATKGNEVGLRRLNAGLSPEQAFNLTPRIANIAPPARPQPAQSVSVKGPQLVIEGNVTPDMVPTLRAEMAAMRRSFSSDVNKVIKRRERRTTPRNERASLGGVR